MADSPPRALIVATSLSICGVLAWLAFRPDDAADQPKLSIVARVPSDDTAEKDPASDEEPVESEREESDAATGETDEAPNPDEGTPLRDRLRAERLLTDAKDKANLLRRGDLLREATRVDPNNAEAFELLAAYEVEQENSEAARKAAARCLELDKTNKRCKQWQRLGHIRDEGLEEETLRLYQECLRESPGDYNCAIGHVHALNRLGRYAEAKKELDAIPDAGVRGDLARAIIVEKSGDSKQAQALYQRVCTERGTEFACRRSNELQKKDGGDAG